MRAREKNEHLSLADLQTIQGLELSRKGKGDLLTMIGQLVRPIYILFISFDNLFSIISS